MPIYEYQCQNCQHVTEVLQKISDKPLVDCPECGAAAMKKLVSAPSFKLTGTGWYETDFKNKGGNASTKSDSKDTSSDSTSSAKSADSAKSTGSSNDSGAAKSADS